MIEKTNSLTVMAVWVAIFAFIKFILAPQSRTFSAFLTGMVVAVPTGILVGAIAMEHFVGEYSAIGLACVSALVANDVVLAIITRAGNAGLILDTLLKRWQNKQDKEDKDE